MDTKTILECTEVIEKLKRVKSAYNSYGGFHYISADIDVHDIIEEATLDLVKQKENDLLKIIQKELV